MLFMFSRNYFKLLKRTKPSLLFRKNISNIIQCSPTNLGYKSRGLMAENNVCKTIRQEIHAVYYDKIC